MIAFLRRNTFQCLWDLIRARTLPRAWVGIWVERVSILLCFSGDVHDGHAARSTAYGFGVFLAHGHDAFEARARVLNWMISAGLSAPLIDRAMVKAARVFTGMTLFAVSMEST